MKIGLFHPAFTAIGGAEMLALTQAAYLRDAGCEVEIVTFGFDQDLWGPTFGKLPVRIAPRRGIGDALCFWSRSAKWLARGRRAESYLREYDAVLAHNPPSSYLLGRANIEGRKFWYCHESPWRLHPERTKYFLIHGLDSQRDECAPDLFLRLSKTRSEILARSRHSFLQKRFDLFGVSRLDKILANSAFCQETLQGIYGRKDIAVVPPIVRFAETSHRPGLDRCGLQVMVQARLELLKNVETVLRGFALFASRGHGSPKLHIVGDGRERNRLQALAHSLDLKDAVLFHGYLDWNRHAAELQDLYATCDVFAMLPIDESFGLVYPEAASRGLLLIGPDHGGPVEILEGGRLGTCVPALSGEAFCEALEEVWKMDDQEADRRRFEADRSCRARFSVEVVGPMLKNVIDPGS